MADRRAPTDPPQWALSPGLPIAHQRHPPLFLHGEGFLLFHPRGAVGTQFFFPSVHPAAAATAAARRASSLRTEAGDSTRHPSPKERRRCV